MAVVAYLQVEGSFAEEELELEVDAPDLSRHVSVVAAAGQPVVYAFAEAVVVRVRRSEQGLSQVEGPHDFGIAQDGVVSVEPGKSFLLTKGSEAWLLAHCDGQWEAPSPANPLMTSAAIIAHVDADDTSDLIAVGFDSTVENEGSSITQCVFGLGTPGSSKSTREPFTPERIDVAATGDLDGDGLDDIVAIASGGMGDPSDPRSSSLIVALGDGMCRFAPASTRMLPDTPPSIELAELDGQPGLDVVVGGPSGLRFFAGDGAGSLGEPTLVSSDTTRLLATGPLAGAPHIDDVVGMGTLNTLVLHIDGTQRTELGTASFFETATIVDLDEDGQLDIAAAKRLFP